MNILLKFRETATSVIPVMLIVAVLGPLTGSMALAELPRFLLSGLLLITGLTSFLLGVDLGIQPMGERSGAALTECKSLALLLAVAFVIGFIVTAAEPDIQVFGDQVHGMFGKVNKTALVFSIAGGVGLFITAGLARTVLALPIKGVLFISYLLLMIIAFFAPRAFVGIAFDSGGATTGPMTVPFIMALGLGVSSVRADKDGGFGLTGICSVGPVMAVLLYSVFAGPDFGKPLADDASEAITAAGVFKEVFHESLISILPLYGLFVIFQFLLLKLTGVQFRRLTKGFVYALLGLVIFLFGVKFGFMHAGQALGEALGTKAQGSHVWFAGLLATGLALGAITVCAEPAVWVLTEQVEQVSGGTIRRKSLLVFLAAGTAIAIGLAVLRAIFAFNLAYILLPGYVLAMALMYFAPNLFAGIAFDSGGVASGPLTSTFILSFTLGAASGGSGSTDSFGVIALVAMMPLIAIQLMGIIYERQRKKSMQGSPEGKGGAR